MKQFSKWFMILSAMIVLLIFIPALVHGQIGNPGCDPLDPTCPIDGGLSLLLAAGVGYGIKKARNTRKNRIIKTQT